MSPINRFCLSHNLEYYFKKKNIAIEEWQLFLIMNIPGFLFNGLDSKTLEIIQGLNGDSYQFLENLLFFFKNELKIIINDEDPGGSFEDSFLFVDDYDLPYTENYQKIHNIRFILFEKEQQYYDLGVRQILKQDIFQSRLNRFKLLFQTDNFEINSRLSQQLLAKGLAFNNETAIKNLTRFYNQLNQVACSEQQLYYALFYSINRPSGPANTILQLVESLQKLQREHNDFQLTHKIEPLFEIAENWKILGNLFFRISRDWQLQHLSRAINKLEQIIGLYLQYNLIDSNQPAID